MLGRIVASQHWIFTAGGHRWSQRWPNLTSDRDLPALGTTARNYRWKTVLESIAVTQRWPDPASAGEPPALGTTAGNYRWDLSRESISGVQRWALSKIRWKPSSAGNYRWERLSSLGAGPSRRLSAGQEFGQTLSSVRYKLQEEQSNETARSGGEKIHYKAITYSEVKISFFWYIEAFIQVKILLVSLL